LRQDLSQADLITLTVGGNDVLKVVDRNKKGIFLLIDERFRLFIPVINDRLHVGDLWKVQIKWIVNTQNIDWGIAI